MNQVNPGGIILKSRAGTYPSTMQGYIDEVKENDLKTAFKNQMPAAEIFFESISEELSKRKIEVLLTLGAGDIDTLVTPIKNFLTKTYSAS